jgi:predicted RNA-binding protein (virulence factor B family)
MFKAGRQAVKTGQGRAMAELGRYNTLTVSHGTAHGAYLDGGEHGEILIPTRYVPSGTQIGDSLEVFIYRDSEDRVIATTEHPLAQVGEFATLRVVSINRQVGAFLDWALPKDLLLPFREQEESLRVGDTVVVRLLVDPKTDRIIASARLNRHLEKKPPTYKPGQKVKLIITRETPLGYNALVEGGHMGLLHRAPQSPRLSPGQSLEGYVAAVRPGGKIDLSLDASGYQRVAPLTDQILARLKAAGGVLPFDDESSPDAIREAFGVSKKAFKQATGALFRKRQIEFTRPGIRQLNVADPKPGDWHPKPAPGNPSKGR